MLKIKEGINLNLSHVEASSDNYFRDISVVQLKKRNNNSEERAITFYGLSSGVLEKFQDKQCRVNLLAY